MKTSYVIKSEREFPKGGYRSFLWDSDIGGEA